MNIYEQYLDGESRINEGLIRHGVSMARPEGYVKKPKNRMATMADFLHDCGNPQNGIPAVHVAGTSGKGSVCAKVAGILKNAGLKVGLHVSPYLQSATEKIWFDGQYASGAEFKSLVDWVMPIAIPRVQPETPASIHGMASVAIALEYFRRVQADVIVFEAGCGARYDLTSFVDTKVGVVTNVGLDHLISLGPGIEQIAWHKAGVARAGMPLVTGATGSSLGVIQKETEQLGCELIHIPKESNPLDHNNQIAKTAGGLMLRHMKVNEPVDTDIDEVTLPGRCEKMPGTCPTVFIDGAHNQDKMKVAIRHFLSNCQEGPKIAVVGFLGSKATPKLLEPLVGHFDHVIATEPRVYGKSPFPAAQTAALAASIGFEPVVAPDPGDALKKALMLASGNGSVLVTGSFYLVGELREKWFKKRDVVRFQNSWPNLDPA